MASKVILEKLLLEARALDNMGVRPSDRVEQWRRQVDLALKGADGDRPEDRYDTEGRVRCREEVRKMFL